ncbi:hypothetical protein ACS0TY_008613 [Phlomoides rotata]
MWDTQHRITTSLVNEAEIYGRSEDKEVIMEKLLAGSCSEDDLCVHAIQGMGGLGKTTLAQMVYNDERTQRRFDLRIWVCVSDDFSVAGIVRAILESIEGGGCNISTLDPLQRRLQEKLRGRRYLLVLDDIWNENQRLWDALKEVLRCGSQGSVTIVTTRIEKVASMMSTTGIHRINYLSEDDSWALFKQRAFSNEEGEDNFIAIGKVIVKKCGGVPLVIKALGSLMRLKSHEREWVAIKESEMWHLSDDENAILPALRLSYDNLLPQMRQCFAYCCIFPKDFLMEEDRLIRLWMANGYIPSDGPTDMHLTGQLIFKELVWRSFLQDVQINVRGNMSCRMHDLMHDLASSVMKHETYILEYNKKLQIPKTVHHLSISPWSFRNVPDIKSVLKLPIDHSLRSMIVHDVSTKGILALLLKQKYLRAFEGYFFHSRKLPNIIGKLEHLRYLVMDCNNMKSLPESLTNLHNLQTLILMRPDVLRELPKGLKVMTNLWISSRYSMWDTQHRITTSLVNEAEIYGRSEDKEVIMEKLLAGSCSEDDLCVHAIQGMGGLGKTTLAQMVYNDERTQRRFDLRIWVCVSDDFSVAGIVRAILESIEGGGCNISTLDPLQRRLQEKLRGRRYLLVLDDIWNENQRLWDALKEVLRCGSQGSVTIVTTRIEKVASMMSTTGIHRINYLSEDDSWALFKQRAFSNEEGEDNFIAIGKVIVKKCGGVPLVIKALGSLMRLKSHEREWVAIKESEMWHLSDDENAILPALRLSYDNLLPQMRQCFAYCCIFPKDFLMEEDRLIRLWMANGYIPSDGPTDMHLTGQLIFKELVWRSFLQDVQINVRGNMSCRMHDLMHDLASSVMKHETYILEYNKKLQIPKTVHHLSISPWSFRNVPDIKSVLKLPIDHSLRSMIVHDVSTKGILALLLKQKYLRAFEGYFFHSRKLPNIIGKLEHLRYLVMDCNNMKSLPESLTNLHNLQTLILMRPDVLRELPKDQLKDLELGGRLSIKGLDNVRSLQDARSANLMTKSNLTCLSLSWKKGIKMECAEHFEEVLQGLQPHQNIEKISIASYHGSRFPGWMSTLVFQKLKEISLRDCPRCEHLPPLGKLPCLKSLSLCQMDSITCLDGECYGDGETSFPALTSLEISNMPNFERWTINSAKGFLPCLDSLHINLCPKLAGLPELPTLKRLLICRSSTSILKSITFLTSLTSLDIFSFPELDVLPTGLLQNHKALERLRIGWLPIQTLSNVLDNLSALKTLSIEYCHNLEYLPENVQLLTSLEMLRISNCEKLKSLPDGFKDLTSLRRLHIMGCAQLEKRCKNPKGEDWHKISRIPLIQINGNVIQHLD